MDADPLTADSPLSMSSAASMAVESTGSGLKLSKEEEDYLEKLMAEKKTVDQTAALDLTQKLLNAGIFALPTSVASRQEFQKLKHENFPFDAAAI
jgi:hypothetical protein